MLLPNRHGSIDSYRYGFQGQEKDDELKGEGNSINYKYRMHDPRVGRFFATDPLEKKYSMLTPYQFSGNRPIDSKEIEGMEGFQYTQYSIVNNQEIPVKQIVEIDIIVLVTSNSNDNISFNTGDGEKLQEILEKNYNPKKTFKDSRRNRRLNRVGKKKVEYTTTIDGHTVPVEFKFNISEQTYEGGTNPRQRMLHANRLGYENSQNTFTSTDGDIVRRTVTVGRISNTSIDSRTIASSGSDGIIFRKKNNKSITHEIMHNFFSYNPLYFMGSSPEKHADESIGGGGALEYGSSRRPSQNNIDFIIKTIPLVNEDEIPREDENPDNN